MSRHRIGKFGGLEVFADDDVPHETFYVLSGSSKLTDYLNPNYLETPVPVDYDLTGSDCGMPGCVARPGCQAHGSCRKFADSDEHISIHRTAPKDQNPKAAQAIADGKLPLHLIDTAMTHPASRVLASGAAKYGKRNWRKVPINASTYVGALRRHTDEWADGVDADHDSGEHPLAHIAATCNVVLDAIKHGTLVDDRGFTEANTADPTEHYIAGDGSELPFMAISSEVVEETPTGATHYCGIAKRDNNPNQAWLSPGCCETPCALSRSGCPGLQAGSFVAR